MYLEKVKVFFLSFSFEALHSYCHLLAEDNSWDKKARSGIEIGMLGVLVLGRWLLPRGELTRDQLSALLLNFISNGADIVGKSNCLRICRKYSLRIQLHLSHFFKCLFKKVDEVH